MDAALFVAGRAGGSYHSFGDHSHVACPHRKFGSWGGPIPFPDWLPYILWSITAGVVLFTGLFLLKELLPRKKIEGKAIVIQLDREEVYRL